MQRLATGIAVLFLVILSFYSTDAINCYACLSATSPGCGQTFDKTNLNTTTFTLATNGSQLCAKIQLGNQYVRGPVDPSNCPNNGTGCYSATENGTLALACCCNTDLCNGVSSIQHQYFLLISAISVFIVIKNVFTI
ncbi:unnamed protein product [Adineta steineri]|uniref:Protein sleepless n=1 Tax=Adineta steineri TaxID=433720 RepID=A0A814V1W9_9BILA|nr:unnamed protein product [Adineta steineri]CAF3647734.1 unnamed protein product [Adineta steineri]